MFTNTKFYRKLDVKNLTNLKANDCYSLDTFLEQLFSLSNHGNSKAARKGEISKLNFQNKYYLLFRFLLRCRGAMTLDRALGNPPGSGGPETSPFDRVLRKIPSIPQSIHFCIFAQSVGVNLVTRFFGVAFVHSYD